MLLQLDNVETRYGDITALHGISLSVEKGEIVALLGANGAGKSTTLKTISRVLHPSRGSVVYDGRNLEGYFPEDCVALGIAHVPEGRKIFPGLTVVDNLALGAIPARSSKSEIAAGIESAFALFPKLRALSGKLGWTLSGGEQQMLAIARGLMAKPTLLLLDEPSLGLAPLIVKDVMETIVRIKHEGTTVLLVEQNAHLALQIADRAYVLETGRIALSGSARTLLESDDMRRAYLGSAVRTKERATTSPQ
jgi:branched-chain amino acid transport system ATP-binding protein